MLTMSPAPAAPLAEDVYSAKAGAQQGYAATAAVAAAAAAAAAGGGAAVRVAPLPHIHHATSSRSLKGEDAMAVSPLGSLSHSTLYMVCDGHAGPEAANFVTANFLRVLNTKLPTKLPDFSRSKETRLFAENVRKALCETFVRLDNEWSNYRHHSGTTVSVALATGWLLTTANTGDSACVLDTGCSMLEMTSDHRIHSCVREQARLKDAHQYVASLGFHLQGPAKPGEPGVGPLRIWPGGLCVSRSIGDLDAGPEVVPVPHIKQVMMPENGCRLIMASDGLWDVMSQSKAVTTTRSKPTSAAAQALIQAVERDLRIQDDATIIVVDMLPHERTSFPTVVLLARPEGARKAKKAKSSSGGMFSCFKVEVEEPDSRDAEGLGHLQFYANVDCLLEYPGLRQLINRSAQHNSKNGSMLDAHQAKKPIDFSLHGGKVYTSDGATLLAHGLGKAGAEPASGGLGGDGSVNGMGGSVRLGNKHVPPMTRAQHSATVSSRGHAAIVAGSTSHQEAGQQLQQQQQQLPQSPRRSSGLLNAPSSPAPPGAALQGNGSVNPEATQRASRRASGFFAPGITPLEQAGGVTVQQALQSPVRAHKPGRGGGGEGEGARVEDVSISPGT